MTILAAAIKKRYPNLETELLRMDLEGAVEPIGMG